MTTKTAPINMRVDPSVRNIIDAAAELLHIDRTTFIRQAAVSEARLVLANQRDFTLDDKGFDAFEKAFKATPSKNKKMIDLLNRKSPWE